MRGTEDAARHFEAAFVDVGDLVRVALSKPSPSQKRIDRARSETQMPKCEGTKSLTVLSSRWACRQKCAP